MSNQASQQLVNAPDKSWRQTVTFSDQMAAVMIPLAHVAPLLPATLFTLGMATARVTPGSEVRAAIAVAIMVLIAAAVIATLVLRRRTMTLAMRDVATLLGGKLVMDRALPVLDWIERQGAWPVELGPMLFAGILQRKWCTWGRYGDAEVLVTVHRAPGGKSYAPVRRIDVFVASPRTAELSAAVHRSLTELGFEPITNAVGLQLVRRDSDVRALATDRVTQLLELVSAKASYRT